MALCTSFIRQNIKLYIIEYILSFSLLNIKIDILVYIRSLYYEDCKKIYHSAFIIINDDRLNLLYL